jgi:hypothetical protein
VKFRPRPVPVLGKSHARIIPQRFPPVYRLSPPKFG